MAPQPYAIALETVLSSQRLARYRQPNDGPFDHLGRYFWNMALSEAVYPVVHQLEVALRNSFHSAISTEYGANWFNDADVVIPAEAKRVQEAKAQIASERRDPNDPGRLVAELTFAFWTGLLSSPHVNATKPLWPKLRERVFPYADAGMARGFTRGLKAIRLRFHRVRALRNRVSHHKPIWRPWMDRGTWLSLPGVYHEALDALGWISPELVEVTKSLTRFEEVHAGGLVPITAMVTTLAGRYQARLIVPEPQGSPETPAPETR